MKYDYLSFLIIIHKLLYQIKRKSEIKNKNNYQTFLNYFIFKNYFSINFKKLFYKIEK